MAVKIRLTRVGRHKKPLYRIVVTDLESPRDGRFIEIIGTYDPQAKPASVTVKEQRVALWLQRGARMTDTVRTIFSRNKILKRPSQPGSTATQTKA